MDRGHRPEITISSCWYDLFPTHDHVSPLDGIHSFSDLLSDFITLSVVKLSRKPPNKFFPYEFSTLNYSFHPFFSRYGFGRIESIGAVSISLCLLSAGIYVGWESLQTLLTVLHGTTNMVLDIHDITSLLVYFSFLFLSFYRSDQAFSCSPFCPKNCCSVGHFTSVWVEATLECIRSKMFKSLTNCQCLASSNRFYFCRYRSAGRLRTIYGVFASLLHSRA